MDVQCLQAELLHFPMIQLTTINSSLGIFHIRPDLSETCNLN